jgi:hypothetical protein
MPQVRLTNASASRRVEPDGRGKMTHFNPGQSRVVELTDKQIARLELLERRGVRDLVVARLGEPDNSPAAPDPPTQHETEVVTRDHVGLAESRATRAREILETADDLPFSSFKAAAKEIIPTDQWPGGSTLKKRVIVDLLRELAESEQERA